MNSEELEAEYQRGYETGKKEERQRIAERVSEYTLDLCENSQDFKNTLLTYLQESDKQTSV